jgi:hypothetical protein
VETIIARCCGLDVHKARLTACVRLLERGRVVELVESFGTTTPDLLALRDWLGSLGVTHVAMESTGVYWKCVYSTRWKTTSSCCWSTPSTSSTCLAAVRPTRSTRRGLLRSCWRTGC